MKNFTLNPNASITRQPISDNQFCLVIDDFLQMPNEAVTNAQEHAGEFKLQPQGYPGTLYIPHKSHLVDINQFFSRRLSRELDFCRTGVHLASVFSMVTKQPNELNWAQRMCHTDPRTAVKRKNVAGLIYLFNNPQLGGTSFYHFRNRKLLEQAIKIGNADMPGALKFLQQHLPMFREPPCYITASCDVAELLLTLAPKFNRAIFYSGNIPHSGHIAMPELLTDDATTGRLTLNFFASVVPK